MMDKKAALLSEIKLLQQDLERHSKRPRKKGLNAKDSERDKIQAVLIAKKQVFIDSWPLEECAIEYITLADIASGLDTSKIPRNENPRWRKLIDTFQKYTENERKNKEEANALPLRLKMAMWESVAKEDRATRSEIGKRTKGKERPKARNPVREAVGKALDKAKRNNEANGILLEILRNWQTSPPDRLEVEYNRNTDKYKFTCTETGVLWTAGLAAIQKLFSSKKKETNLG
jgi:hypothetical protein